jgi:N-acetylglucosamine malate deacetylase 2
LMKQKEGRAPRIVEYALYHAWQGRLRAGEFLPRSCAPIASLSLEPAARVLKCRMLACFATQCQTLLQFQTEVERFRSAPLYNFNEPPHYGLLHYENSGCAIGADEWRRYARATLRELAIA